MRLIATFIRLYPAQTLVTLLALLVAGIAEGFGMSMLLPLLGIALNRPESAAGGAGDAVSTLEALVTGFFNLVGATPTVGMLLCLFVISIVLKSILVLVAQRRVGNMVAQVATDLRLTLIRALFATRWSYYVRQPVGRLANAVATEANRSAEAYLFGIRLLASFLHAMVYAAVALMLAWKATLVTIAAGAVILYALRLLVTMARTAGRSQTRLLKSLLALLTDTLQSIKPLKSMARENQAGTVLRRETLDLNQALQRQVFSTEALRALQESLIILFFAFGIYVALTWWRMPLATVLVMAFMLTRMLKTLQKAQKEQQAMGIAESAYWSLQAKIDAAEKAREPAKGTRAPAFDREIRIVDVDFAYEERRVLSKTTMTFPKGSFSAITGPSGVGKTTVVDLITGLLDPQQGRVWVDDIPLDELDIRSWRRMIGYVPQETLLLHDTVSVNVALGDSAFTEAHVVRALREAGAWDFVTQMPHGIHSVVGERGSRLSGGQRQRVTIARALVHDPALLILDEATSALDPASEAEICQTLRRLSGRRTILAISHQGAVLNAADRVYRLSNGTAELVDEHPRHPG